MLNIKATPSSLFVTQGGEGEEGGGEGGNTETGPHFLIKIKHRLE